MYRALPIAVVLLLGGAALFVTGVLPPAAETPPPEPEITTIDVTDRGCDADLREFAASGDEGNGSSYATGTILVDSQAANLSARIHRTSPDDADVRTYRVDVDTHSPANATTASCQPEIAYRVEFTAPSGPVGNRHALIVDGQVKSCGGATSGPDIGCDRLMAQYVPTAWSNASERTN